MKLTKFPKLKRALECLDPEHIAKKLSRLDAELRNHGLRFDAQNTAVTQEGIFYIEPGSGIATKVIAYIPEYQVKLTTEQIRNLAPEGYSDKGSLEQFSRYHLVRCNTLANAAKTGWAEPYRLSRRTEGKFHYRILEKTESRKIQPKVYQEIENQQLQICPNCFVKVASILVTDPSLVREEFDATVFFDVDHLRSWNSLGLLSKDVGFTKDMLPNDWLEICRIRMAQVHYHCEYCFDDLSDPDLRPFLVVHSVDHVENRQGYVKVQCLCLACVAEIPGFEHVKQRRELHIYKKYLELHREQRTETEEVVPDRPAETAKTAAASDEVDEVEVRPKAA